MKPSGKWEMIKKNPDSFYTIQKMENDLEKSGQFLKPSGKWEMIRKNLDSCETVWKIRNDPEKSRWFQNGGKK